jgi:three-Cys-motif partner protein
MIQRPFAHRDTQVKLRTVGDYLRFYTTALSKQNFKLIYFDAFAGSGEIPHGEDLPLFDGMRDLDDAIEGSARVALGVSPPFDQYVFVDSKKKHVAALAALRKEFPNLADRISVKHGDANDAVREFCRSEMAGNRRAVIFLDPFGNSVKWSTIKAIAAVPKIDLWYLFPSGIGVVRQISQDSRIQKDAERSLDEMFGTTEWRASFSAPTAQADLLDPDRETMTKIATADDVTRYMIARMKAVFKGVVLDCWLPLGKKGGHWVIAHPLKRWLGSVRLGG